MLEMRGMYQYKYQNFNWIFYKYLIRTLLVKKQNKINKKVANWKIKWNKIK